MESLDALSDRIRASLEPDVRRHFSPEFIICSEYFDRFTVETAGRALDRLDLLGEFRTPTTPREAIARRGYAERAETALRWMLEKLAEEGFFEAGEGGRFVARVPLPPAESGAKEKALAVSPGCAPGFTVVEALSESIEDFFAGRKSGEEILFAPSRLSLWFDYFNNDNLLYAVNNRLGAEAAARALPSTRPAAVLELGGGAGSAAHALLEHLAAEGRLGNVARYLFTEPVPAFLRRGERSLKARFPEVPLECRKLDMNLSLVEQGIAPGSIDLVYAVNTIHVARDLRKTLAAIREVVAPGGAVVFSECVRPRAGQPIYIEFIFNFLENFVNVVTDPEIRPTHGFLTPDNWRAALRSAGFEKTELLPDVDALAREYPSFFVGAITARRPIAG
ncbi:MAG TPA: class I SAM-dependent methyltransferase [Thermoanaerobaculia bacterium]|nr:class I SAM-dependent methyltransferase [Thermoanaerobaculia bacterium]